MTLALASKLARAAARDPSVREMEGSLLQGNGPMALEFAARAESQLRAGPDLDYVRCVQSRFKTAPCLDRSLDPFVAEVMFLYHRYWYETFLAPGDESESEARLGRGLQKSLAIPNGACFDSIETKLSKQFTERRYFLLLGRTPPLRELMIWKKQTSRNFHVELPSGHHSAKVFLLDEFVSFGWASWATCERRATGGWASQAALYAPLPRYSSGIEGNDFQSSFLAHEAQHLADKQEFIDLQPWELEYRAKLAELWTADEVVMADRLAKFEDSQSEDSTLPHHHANRHVIADLQSYLSKALSMATADEIHNAARALLKSDSDRCRRKV